MKNQQGKDQQNCQDSFYKANEKIYNRTEVFCDKTKKKRKQYKKYLKYAALYLGAFILGMLTCFLIRVCTEL